MAFRLSFTPEAKAVLTKLEAEKNPKLKKVQKTLGYLKTNPRHPGPETHEFSSLSGPRGRESV